MVEPQVGHRRADQLITTAATWSAIISGLVVGLLIAMSWVVSYALGGSNTVGPQLFHIPTVLAATRFGAKGTAVSAVVSGLVCGPALPLHVGQGQAQSFGNWFSRLIIFLAVGQIVAALHSRSVADAGRRLQDQQIVHEMHAAVARGEFVPAYQPIVDLRTGTILGAEALARWRRGDEVVQPGGFVADAERTGIIDEIDRCILSRACSQVATWMADGLVGRDFHISVNLSAHHLADPELVDSVAEVLAASGLPSGCLILEVTETGLIEDPVGAAARLAQLRALGTLISLDDFGVGQSSLGNLARFPIDTYKIDRAFIVGAEESERGRALVGSVVNLAADMSFASPVAEGIETEAQLRTLVELGCRKGQGFLFARPAFAADIEELLARGAVSMPRVV